jgi:hypothetical protein
MMVVVDVIYIMYESALFRESEEVSVIIKCTKNVSIMDGVTCGTSVVGPLHF